MRPAAVFTGLAGMAVVSGLLIAAEARLRGGTGGEDMITVEAPATETAAEPAPEAAGPSATISDADAEIIARGAQPAAPSPAPAEGTTVTPPIRRAQRRHPAGKRRSRPRRSRSSWRGRWPKMPACLPLASAGFSLPASSRHRPTGYAGRQAGNGPAA